jgi:hypothetical protein
MTNEPFASLARAALRMPIEDELRGRFGFERGGKTGRGTSGALGARLSKALHGRKFSGAGSAGSAPRPLASDPRQRAVVKVSFRKHAAGGGSGGGKLLAHASYLERDGAAREGEQGRFYDRSEDEVEGARNRLRDWAPITL